VREIFTWAGLPPSPVADAFATELPRVNDATPGLKRRVNGELRYAADVRAALDRLERLDVENP
jgi:hypothetical protein